MTDWRPIDTAPRDGSKIWVWLFDSGIRMARWMEAVEAAELEDGKSEDFASGWIDCSDLTDSYWHPMFWKPIEEIGVPKGVEFIDVENGGRWREVHRSA